MITSPDSRKMRSQIRRRSLKSFPIRKLLASLNGWLEVKTWNPRPCKSVSILLQGQQSFGNSLMHILYPNASTVHRDRRWWAKVGSRFASNGFASWEFWRQWFWSHCHPDRFADVEQWKWLTRSIKPQVCELDSCYRGTIKVIVPVVYMINREWWAELSWMTRSKRRL